MTLTEKILARAAGKTSVQSGDNIWVNADVLMTHDVCGPGTIGVFKREFGQTAKVWDKNKVVIIPDHYIFRSEERRVGKECRSRWSPHHSSRRRHTRCLSDWSSDVCSSDLAYSNANSARPRKSGIRTRSSSSPTITFSPPTRNPTATWTSSAILDRKSVVS